MICGLALATVLPASAAPRQSPDGVWEQLDAMPAAQQQRKPWVRPPKARPVKLQRAALGRVLTRVQPEGAEPTEIQLPMPDGSFARFKITESLVMAPALAARYPNIKTYAGRGVDDPAATIRLDWTPAGFHAQVLSPRGAVYIDPYTQGDTEHYSSYQKRDYRKEADSWVCLARGGDAPANAATADGGTAARSGATLRTYRLACSATAEYTAYHGGTVESGLAAIVTAVNRVTGVYETELAIRLVLVANNDLLVFTAPATDPFTNDNASSLLTQNQSTCDSLIGSANYDIGHVFSTAGGGLAGLGVVCVTGSKARGETGLTAPTGDAFYIDYVAHEMGHQFGANHTFNSETSHCSGGNRNAATAYEPGSGSTIMAYAGICGADDLQPHSDPYFHSVSFDEIIAYVAASGTCSANTPTGNTAPSVTAGASHTIPVNTPFALTATGSDSDGDALTYCWEERDLGAAQTLTSADNGASPLFRSFNPTNTATRVFPKLSALLNNTNSVGERLPTTARPLKFRVTARDNRASGGGVNSSDLSLTVTTNAGPFVVTYPNTSMTLSGAVTVTWDVAGTAAAPVNAANIHLRLSTDGGWTYPLLLAANLPNDGAQTVVLPNITTTQARLMVEAADNVFFDVSDANFTIVPGEPTPFLTGAGGALVAESCLPGNSAPDPGEPVTFSFALGNTGSGNTSNLVATLLPVGGITNPGGPQTYGVVTAGAAAVSRTFTLTPTGSCGGTVAAVLQLQDGATDYGLVTNLFTLGATSSQVHAATNSAGISIPQRGAASPFPSTINVSNVTGAVTKVTVTLAGLSHSYPDDLDILLVGPTGQKVMLLSDAGGGTDLADVNLTFDAGGAALADAAITSGTYQPADFESGDSMSSPAPDGPYGTALGVFSGADPNGTWSLYVQDDSAKDSGNLVSWRLNITTSQPACCQHTNQPPTITAAVVGPAAPATTNDLVAVVTSANDPENDNLSFAYQWQHAGTNIAFTAAMLPAAATVGGQSYRCVITPSDGQTNGTAFTTEYLLVAADADGDEMNDDWEVVMFGSLAALPVDDGDGDGFSNRQEFLAGTDPRSATSALRITSLLPGGELRFTTEAGKSYVIEYRDDMQAGTWDPLTNGVVGTGRELSVTDPDMPGLARRFYRVRLLP